MAGLAAASVWLSVVAPNSSGAAAPTYVKAERACADPAPGRFGCFAERLVTTSSPGDGAKPFVARAGLTAGPAGGFTPASLATAYGIVNSGAATSQKVAVVDAYDDPRALADLNVFDKKYGLPAETATSFKKVAQSGKSNPLPTSDAGWAVEISLDVQAVRGLCHKCSILLVEANTADEANFAAAENAAVTLGATVVSNSFGGPEPATGISNSIVAAFNHSGVVITASTGDDGMFDWDVANAGFESSNAPNYPASLRTVVAVGGTSLTLNSNGTRRSETVWNANGPNDVTGASAGPRGATGGGCSTKVTAPRWQSALAVWRQTTCGSHRLVADVSADADPFTGFDVYDSYQNSGWQTVGGTSLSAPLIAAMWADAGGGRGTAYPAVNLYGHSKSDPASVFDVTSGGSGFCDGQSSTACARAFGRSPNAMRYGILDCAFLPNSATLSAGSRACDAATGFDGASGVGSPTGTALFKPMKPAVSIGGPTTLSVARAGAFPGRATDPYPGGTIGTYRWAWGDGSTSTGRAPSHAYKTAGTYRITLTVSDSYQQIGTATRSVTVS